MINNSTNVKKKKEQPPLTSKHLINKKNTPIYANVNQGPGLGQAHKSDEVKPVNESPTVPFLTI